MTDDEASTGQPLAGDEIWVYAPSQAAATDAIGADGFRSKGVFSRHDDEGLRRVTVSDDELQRVTGQVDRMVGVLDSSATRGKAGSYSVDTITVHLGVSATGRFFFVAEAGMEASVEITWKRSTTPGD